MIPIGYFPKSLKDLKRTFIHFIHKYPKICKMLDHPFGLVARGSKQKMLIVYLIVLIICMISKVELESAEKEARNQLQRILADC